MRAEGSLYKARHAEERSETLPGLRERHARYHKNIRLQEARKEAANRSLLPSGPLYHPLWPGRQQCFLQPVNKMLILSINRTSHSWLIFQQFFSNFKFLKTCYSTDASPSAIKLWNIGASVNSQQPVQNLVFYLKYKSENIETKSNSAG